MIADEEFTPTRLGSIKVLIDCHKRKSVEEKVTQEEVLRVGPPTHLEPHMEELIKKEFYAYVQEPNMVTIQDPRPVKRMRRS